MVYYFGAKLTWFGRELAGYTKGNKAIAYQYDVDGMRYMKTVSVNGTETARYDYVYSDGTLILLTYTANGVANTARFVYDSFGEPRGFILNDSATYLYLKNGQGDITAIVGETGDILVRYEYNAWGAVEFIVPFGVDPAVTSILATVSPFTYRGYCYDYDIGMYYLQSRYYDPGICRFINADSTDYLGSTGTVLSYNLFAYCENDGVDFTDYSGFLPNKVNLYWQATGSQIIIYAQNIGVDTIDLLNGQVKIGNTTKSFKKTKLRPLKTYKIYVNFNMLKCRESIIVTFFCLDGKTHFGNTSLSGNRDVPSNLINYWHNGTYKTKEMSINDHFYRHGKEVSSYNILDYVNKAIKYRNEVVNDIKKLSKTKLNNKYKISTGTGSIASKKYKNKKDRRYIILTNKDYKILSFGR